MYSVAGRRWQRTWLTGTLAVAFVALVLIAAFVVIRLTGDHTGTAGGASSDEGSGSWTRTSLTVQTNALLHDPSLPNVVWAGTSDGAWLSLNGGQTWTKRAAGLAGHGVLSLASATGSRTIVAGAENGGVYVGSGTPGGSWHWRLINHPLASSQPTFCVAISTGADPTILAGTTGAIYRGSRVSSGWTWRRVATTNGSGVTSVVWAPWDQTVAYASVFGTAPAVLVTHDGGRHWTADTQGLPEPLPSQTLRAVASQPPSVIFTTMGGGVWLQQGGKWRDISAGLPARHGMPLIVTGIGRNRRLYTGTMGFGVYMKKPQGRWVRLGSGLAGGDHTVLGLVSTGGSHSNLLAATALGVFRYNPAAGSAL